nr:dipeptidyl-peptidase 7-like [Nerophis lumbriciformis]
MKRLIFTAALVALATPANADEGMWTLNNFPADRVAKKYGFSADQAWLDEVRLSSVRLAGGCSASFISKDGLVLTNHHCAHRCLEQLSTKRNDLVAKGFYAKQPKGEKRCPAMEINQLVSITDVTARMNAATKGLEGAAFKTARKAETARIEKDCAKSDQVRCDVVSLYHGGRYDLYAYRRHQDVRLVFAPELDIAFFGGDPDNFNFPRYVVDMAILRVYEDGKPADTPHHFGWSDQGSKDGELVFVSGHPGSTKRLKTMAQLEYYRDVYLPDRLYMLAELRGQFTAFSQQSKENERIAKTDLFRVENGYKALRGRHAALLDKEFFASKASAERDLRKKVEGNRSVGELSDAWPNIERAMRRARDLRTEYNAKEARGTFGSALMDDRAPPGSTRRRDHQAQQRASPRLREELGPDDPFVRQVLGRESPASLANKLLRTKLKNVKFRKKLFKGGAAAIAASKDPMVVLARSIDDAARKIRKTYETEVESVLEKNEARVAKARFAILGTSTYPDATFTLRLSYGAVRGFEHRGKVVPPYTKIGGAFDRATGRVPFKLPGRWNKKKSKLTLDTPMNFVTTNDIIGGNSGSPIINKDRQIVGLIFDGNIYSLGGNYGFDERVNRSVAVDSRAIREVLTKLYGAERLLPAAATR